MNVGETGDTSEDDSTYRDCLPERVTPFEDHAEVRNVMHLSQALKKGRCCENTILELAGKENKNEDETLDEQ